MSVYLIVIGILVCLCFSAFFSAAEMSYSSCNILRLEKLAEDGSVRAKNALRITENFDSTLSTILIGNNLANIAGSSLASVLVMLIAGSDNYAWVATVFMTLLVIIFGETIPKITAKKNSNKYSLKFAYIIRALSLILFPLTWLVVRLIRILSSPFRGSVYDDNPEEAVEELQSIIETAEDEDVIDEERSELIRSAIDFPEVSVSEVMTARVDVYALDIDDAWEEILKKVEECPFSRLPVYEDSIDNIIGVLYLNHFLKALTEDGSVDIRSFLMSPVYIYKTMKLPDVLNRLKKEKQHLAIVSDEYGGMLGVVSMEDVLEQIVGDIWDDTDTVEQEIIRRSDHELELDGHMIISDFLELVNIREDDFDYESDTVGGWTVEMFGEFPKAGDSFDYGKFSVSVLAMDGRRVEKVLVKINEDN